MKEEQERLEYWEIVRKIENYIEEYGLDADEVLEELTEDIGVL